MKRSIGLVELKSIPVGIKVSDEMLKSANVELVLATPICPGKYVILISGDVGAIKSAVNCGINAGGIFVTDHHIINNVHEDVLHGISGTSEYDNVAAVGIIETISAISSIKAGDTAVKSADVSLIEIRIARGLGGKGFLVFTGEISAVKSAIQAVTNELGEDGEITSFADIPSPHEDLIEKLIM